MYYDEMNTPSQNHAVFTVTQVSNFIKQILDSEHMLSSIYIKGEISNFTNHYKTGHLYFSLKDDGGIIKAVMFKSAAIGLKFFPEEGMKVIAKGRISSYPKGGTYQLYVDSMLPDGVGSLYVAYEQLKRKLEAEGLFSEAYKKPIPKIPSTVGIITSPTGAAVRDMINVTKRRFPFAKLVLYPSLVQGDGAPEQLVSAIGYFDRTKSCDVIIIGRGGGSIEDLWAFNSEQLARAIFKCNIPVISAVGHETDFTICDFVADLRAPTPSAAAELAVPDTLELKRKFNNVITKMQISISEMLSQRRTELAFFAKSRVLTSPKNFIDDRRMNLISLSNDLEASMTKILSADKSRFASLTASLDALNPLAVISRGYSAVFSSDGKLIKSIKQLQTGDNINFKTTDGTVSANVTEIVYSG